MILLMAFLDMQCLNHKSKQKSGNLSSYMLAHKENYFCGQNTKDTANVLIVSRIPLKFQNVTRMPAYSSKICINDGLFFLGVIC